MNWPPALWFVVVSMAVVGCQQGPPAGVDPFGRTTIPPPYTGAAATGAVDPYYNGQAAIAPRLVPVPNNPTGAFARPTIGPTTHSGSTLRSGSTSRPARIGWTASSASSWGTAPDAAGRLQAIPTSLTNTHSAMTPTEAVAGQGGDHSVLVPATATTTTSRAQAVEFKRVVILDDGDPMELSVQPIGTVDREVAALPSGIVTAQAPQPMAQDRRAAGTPTVIPRHRPPTSSASRYGYSEDYAWLKGRLEYSASRRQWKLRYIAVDKGSDDLGGSVVLKAGSSLQDYRDGDFVKVRGQLDKRTAESENFSGTFVPTEITRLH